MIDTVLILIGLFILFVLCFRHIIFIPIALVLALLAFSASMGYPTNAPFPSHAIIYGLTPSYVWAAPKSAPTIPRAYVFIPPPEWFEERNKRKGEAFEVRKQEEKEKIPEQRNEYSYSPKENYIILERPELPPK